jgi:two-component system CheB/CheR fusion protein
MPHSRGCAAEKMPLAQLGVTRQIPTGSLFSVPENLQSDVSLEAFLTSLATAHGLDLRGYKHGTLGRRFKKRMAQLGIKSRREYLEYLAEHPAEKNGLLDTVLINVTEFFRDPQAWDVVGNLVLPRLLRRKRPGEVFRAWVAGCASGEEVYTLAISIAEYLGDRLQDFDINIYATDVDDQALEIARRGDYPAERLRRIPARLREQYFRSPKFTRIKPEIRRMVIFGKGDLVHDAPIPHVELIV